MNICRQCACTDNSPCLVDEKGQSHTLDSLAALSDEQLEDAPLTPCHWVEFNLCSACLQPPAPPPLLYDFAGRPLRGAP